MKAFTGTAALALLLAGCGGDSGGNSQTAAANNAAPVETVAAPNGGDWTQTVAQSPEGGMLMGNPAAPVKVIEYASYTCPACASFSATGRRSSSTNM
jgi:protein-disulfide isomerase